MKFGYLYPGSLGCRGGDLAGQDGSVVWVKDDGAGRVLDSGMVA